MTCAPPNYDAILLVSFGGPESPADVVPFLENVTRGRNIPAERLVEVGQHYFDRGGISPINAQNRALLDALRPALVEAGIDLPVYWGNRNWHPMLDDTVAEMAADGIGSALAFVTSAFSSYSGCRQYRENLASACERCEAATGSAPAVDKIRVYYDHPGFIGPMVEHVEAALVRLESDAASRIVFTAHSIPNSMAAGCDYVAQLNEAAARIVDRLDNPPAWNLAYQSRSGPPQVPWLEPDICDHLATLASEGVEQVVVVPLGFISDHMEVIYDLDTQAAEVAAELGLGFQRASTVGTHPDFVAAIVELVAERLSGAPRRHLGALGMKPDVCAVDCCLPPQRPAGAGRPQPT